MVVHRANHVYKQALLGNMDGVRSQAVSNEVREILNLLICECWLTASWDFQLSASFDFEVSLNVVLWFSYTLNTVINRVGHDGVCISQDFLSFVVAEDGFSVYYVYSVEITVENFIIHVSMLWAARNELVQSV